jgi:hypothetical protein
MPEAIEQSPPSDAFSVEPGAHRFDLNRRPFVLRHHLAGHPLFSLERLAQLAEFLRGSGHAGSVLYRLAAVAPHTMGAWDNLSDLPGVGDAIRGCEQSGAWVSLHDTEFDPEYREFLHDVVRAISSAVERNLLAEAAYVTGHIFIGSPRSVTDYHMDSETNFLVIMSGEKHFHLFDGEDTSILPQTVIEDFYWGKPGAVRFDPSFKNHETEIHLQPGDCLHVPVNFPHWVQNGPAPCIALSVLLYLHENVDRAHAFQSNWLWRRLGFRPSPISRVDETAVRRRGWLLRAFAARTPRDKRDVIASGRRRLTAPIRAAKRAFSGWRRA